MLRVLLYGQRHRREVGKGAVCVLSSHWGEEAIKLCNNFTFEDDERGKADVLKRMFQDYCEPKELALHTTHVLHSGTEIIKVY